MDYLYGVIEVAGDNCVLGSLQEVEKLYELDKGVSRKDGFPKDAHFKMSDDYPDNLKLGDVLDNLNDLLVISERFKNLLETDELKNNELIPVKILNHKNRVVKDPYYILHQLAQPEWIDLEKSDLELNDIDPEKIVFLHDLVIDELKIDPSVSVLRMKGFGQVVVFKRNLAERILEAGIEGIEFNEFEDWDVM